MLRPFFSPAQRSIAKKRPLCSPARVQCLFSTFANIINGNTRDSSRVHQGINPSNCQKLWDVPVASRDDLQDAIASAQKAFTTWSAVSGSDRQASIAQLKDSILSCKEEMAELLMKEAGKPRMQATLEVDHACGFLDYFANVKLPSEEVIHEDASLKLSLQYMPLGVIGAIVPWNFPLVLAMAKVAAALAAGNTVIVKPSPYTPYSILKVAELAIPILPRGVFQAINGDDTTGPEMTLHPDINKISFTGSTIAGKHILAATSNTLKECTLELGGNDPAIIFPDVDIHAVAQQVALGAFFNSGQFCLGSKRLYVHEAIYNEFRDALVDVVKTWKVGPVDEDVMLGPIQNEMQFNVVTDIFKDCKANGYNFALEGGPSNGPGYIFHPTIVDRPPDGSRIVTEEPFGPIVPLLSWSDESELISSVNDTKTGLGCSIWAKDVETSKRLAPKIQSGSVWLNSFAKPHPQGYLSGRKESGIGGEWGMKGLKSYCATQTIHYYK
ncbi:aldehyde dehydrogenase 5, mitochondrial [Aspergillus awamori]|uniref:aldehyde dehydrogenase (NAD(+)) n=1 Tax=Aspergillus awamori TaxID=105351 RepID=A0A401KZC9_ASPAW|nr:aldehyde dehydrogenase 5, mitochondrial [Aspergillus awamori]